VCNYSYNIHWKAARDGQRDVPFKDTLEFIDYCHQLGAGGVQVGVGSKEPGYPTKIRAKVEAFQMFFEGQVNLPKDASDVDRFDADLRACKEAGAEIVRAAALSGRRYETFDSADAFRQFAEKAFESLTLAEPMLKKHRVRLALENHKDWRVSEFLDLLKRLSSEWVGVCVDTGNNLALLEDSLMVVEGLAPFAFSSHLKDMALQDYADGFLLSEVPLGEGFLDLKRIVGLLRQTNPKLPFSLEMITRDPLKIPCLTEKYWATMPALPASELAFALGMVRRNASQRPLPHTTGLSIAEQLALEDTQVRKSFAYARRELGL
jgi:sugar phosphate isomerase/epimerase